MDRENRACMVHMKRISKQISLAYKNLLAVTYKKHSSRYGYDKILTGFLVEHEA